MLSGSITGIGSINPFRYPKTPTLLNAAPKNITTTNNASPMVVLRSAVGVLKNGLIIISPFSLENEGTNGNKNDNKLEHQMNINIAPKNGTNRFLYFPYVPKNVFSINL